MSCLPDSVNNESEGRVVYRINTIPEWHNFHTRETQFTILFHYIPFFINLIVKIKRKLF